MYLETRDICVQIPVLPSKNSVNLGLPDLTKKGIIILPDRFLQRLEKIHIKDLISSCESLCCPVLNQKQSTISQFYLEREINTFLRLRRESLCLPGFQNPNSGTLFSFLSHSLFEIQTLLLLLNNCLTQVFLVVFPHLSTQLVWKI